MAYVPPRSHHGIERPTLGSLARRSLGSSPKISGREPGQLPVPVHEVGTWVRFRGVQYLAMRESPCERIFCACERIFG